MIERSSFHNPANLSKAESFNPHINIIKEAHLTQSSSRSRIGDVRIGLTERTHSQKNLVGFELGSMSSSGGRENRFISSRDKENRERIFSPKKKENKCPLSCQQKVGK